ncbi:mevalonate kinase [Actinoplanes lobatus]|uniref:mevalonate kinase n=1 Tax=Actinoplanes lobatus TaxID=113568 RepID=A0A7W7HHY2_9ACTN|nr:mevalonate kinase [Actinoplanes lobatus]MBB4750890.1 mevalonate kinase [Actinoplanes lobatus]GGN92184.1 mevalonate kinase [Actinoplanes lobatus]GIE44443.1 mevalonate kinase [Actinoplanes lobatus]
MSSTDLVTFPGRGGTGADAGRPGVGRAHAKAILLGEHAVVYGAPALVMPMPELTVTVHATRFACPGDGADKISFAIAGQHPAPVTPLVTDGLRYLVEKFRERAAVTGRMCADVLIDSGIPQGRGLGSSAACARAAVLALADAFGRPLDAGAVYDLVQASETVAHGRASGIDALATGATAPLLFRGGSARELPITMSGPRPADGVFVVADSGAGGSTKEAVELLRHRFEQDEQIKEAFVRRVSDLTVAALRDLEAGRLTGFGAHMTENHRLLRDLGISTAPIDAMVEAALAAGGLGAKITGGGLGGCMIALAGDPGRAEAVAHGIEAAGAVRTWVVPVGRVRQS